MRFRVADVEELPFGDGSFDVVLSTFGAMFTPNHTARPAREMPRVVRPGGRIGLANWTPEGFIGELFKLVGPYLPPPADLKSPRLWGTELHILEVFGAQATRIHAERKHSTAAAAARRTVPGVSANATVRRTGRSPRRRARNANPSRPTSLPFANV
jgi:SAM-dependent methyltransferase